MLSEKVKETNTQDEQYIADHTQLKAALGVKDVKERHASQSLGAC